MLESQILIHSGRVLNNIICTTIWMLTETNVYIIVIYVIIHNNTGLGDAQVL